ncbi:HEAT repeat domain-containing protein, partial [Streptomyces sp. NPDC057638]|uniref:HEAT repeat domain-containing protein n=1 Tax=Streptomyces sp. NPDC057638 TaxID=3346190 RepID=UPI00367A5A8E
SSVDEVPVPVDALAEAVLGESDPHVAGALRWALAHTGDAGLARLAEGLDAPQAPVRERAVQSIAELPGEAATALLRVALAHSDVVVRGNAAVALGGRGGPDAVPTLIGMVAEGTRDTDAADALGALAGDPALADRIAAGVVDRLARGADPLARRRLAQALADIPGTPAAQALRELSRDEDRAVALTATYVLTLRDTR